MMLNLSDRKWKVFAFTDVFEIRKGFYNKKPVRTANANIPFLGATDSDNGVTTFLTQSVIEKSSKTGKLPNEPIERKMFPGHAIAVTNNGSVGHAYYQPSRFTCSHDINPLYLKDHVMSELEALFLIPLIEQQGKLFQYARKWRPSRMINSKIMLPVDGNGEPDYKFMSDYVGQQQKQLQTKYVSYAQKKLQILGTEKPLKSLSELDWGYVRINDIATVKSGKDIYARERVSGNIPYVTSGTSNNGIGYFAGNDNKSKANHVISVNRNGAVGEAFYHPYTALFGNDCRTLVLNEQYEYAPFFIATMLRKQKGAFSYSRKLGTARLKVLCIMLPVESDGKPDYDYMEQYIKNKMIQKYNNYLQYLNGRLQI